MDSSVLVALGYGLAGALLVVLPVALGAHADLKRKKSVACPETGRRARIGVDARRAAVGAAFGLPRLRVQVCSRWPARKSCGQPCLKQIRATGIVRSA